MRKRITTLGLLLLFFVLVGGVQAQPVVDANAYSNSLSGAWAGGGGGGTASVSGLSFGMTFESHGATSGGLFRQHRIPGQLSYPFGPGYGGPWGQSHNFGVPVLLKTFSQRQLRNMGYSWWHTDSNNKFPERRGYEYCRIDVEIIPSRVENGVLIMPPIEMAGRKFVGYVHDRATSDKADSMDVIIRGLEEARKAGANKLVIWQHNVTFKQVGKNAGAALQGGISRLLGSEQTTGFSGDLVLGYSTNEVGPDVRPYIRALAFEEGTWVPCVNEGDPVPEVKKQPEPVVKPVTGSDTDKLKKAAEDFLKELNKSQK